MDSIALLPVVTSQNVHSYSYKPTSSEELNEILKAFQGNKIEVKAINLRN